MKAEPVMPPAVSSVVLVVDDAPDTLRMLCDALAIEGYTVLVARDAIEALERFEMAVPDAVLLDAIMPGENGFALCRRLKSEPSWAHVPVIFMTGLAETEQIVEGFASGGVDYVVKPLKIPEVLARLATHLRNAHVSRLAREAVDVAGLGVVLLDSQGRIAWRSPQAMHWLEEALGPQDDATPLKGWLQAAITQGETLTPLPNGSQLQAQYLLIRRGLFMRPHRRHACRQSTSGPALACSPTSSCVLSPPRAAWPWFAPEPCCQSHASNRH